MPTPRQRIEGTLHRSLPATLTIRAAEPGQAGDGLLRLRLSVSSEIPYLRTPFWEDPWIEVLGHKDGEIDLTRFNDGAPILANHNKQNAVGATPLAGIGAVERGWIEGGKLLTDIVISRREALADLRQDIADNLVRNVSIGYLINERVLVKANGEGQPSEYRATSWTPYEVSLVDIPADASVGMGRSAENPPSPAPQQYRVVDIPQPKPSQQGERSMATAENETAQAETTTTTAQPQTRSATALTPPAAPAAAPVAAIREAVRVAGFEPEIALDMIERGLNLDQARAELFVKMGEKINANPTRSGSAYIETLRDETETRRDLMADAIFHRLTPAAKITDGARQYRHMGLLRMAEESLGAAGIRARGLAPMQIAERALHSTSDFPLILANVANKRLRAAYEGAPTTYQLWARRAPNAPDFKDITIVQLGGAPDLVPLGENGEYKSGTVGEGAEKYRVVTFGRKLGFTRQSLINDDLRAFDRLVGGFAASARRLENSLVYKQLTDNPALSDNVALFHATHGNLAAPGTVISAESLGAGRTAMRKQKGLAGEALNLSPNYLICPTDLEQTAYKFTSNLYVPAKQADTNEFRSGGRTAVEPVIDPTLDAISAIAWYMVGDGNACDTVEYCWLDGSEGVYIESAPDFDIDGMMIKARLDFAAKAGDYRAVYKNPGAAPA